MKQKLYSILLLVMAMLCLGANSAWAQEEEPAEQQLSVGTNIITLDGGGSPSFTFNAPANGYYSFQFSVAGSGFSDYDRNNLPWAEFYIDGETTSLLVYNGVIKYNKYLESGDPHTLEIEDVQYSGNVFLQIIGGSYPALTVGENTDKIIPAHDGGVFDFTPSESGYYTFTFSPALSSAPKIGGQEMTSLGGNTYLSEELTDTQWGYALSVPGGNDGFTNMDITIAKAAAAGNCTISANSMSVGGTVSISRPEGYTGELTYKSNNTDVATVDADGVVTGVSEGTATITVTGSSYMSEGVFVYMPQQTLTVTVVVPGRLDAAAWKEVLEEINNARVEYLDTYTVTFADSYSGTDEGISVGTDVKLYGGEDSNYSYVVAPTTEGIEITAPANCATLFANLSNLTAITFTNFNTSSVTHMNSMFGGCSSLQSITFGEKFNTSDVWNMSLMFNGCSNLQSLDLSGFNTSSVTNMNSMFYGCTNLESLTIGNFNMGEIRKALKGAEDMFTGCTNLSTLTMKSLPYLVDGTFNTQFSGEGKTVNVVLDDNSVVYEPYYVGDDVWANSYYPEPTVAPTYTRTIAAASLWGTVVLPFSAAAENNDVQLYYLNAVTFNEEGEGSMEFIKEKDSVYPNIPGAFKKKNKDATTVTFTGAKDTETGKYAVGAFEDPSSGDGYWYIHGTYSKKTDVVQEGLNYADQYITYFIAENKFWRAEDEITVPPFRAWFWYYQSPVDDDGGDGGDGGDGDGGDDGDPGDCAPARTFNIVEANDETQGIEHISDGDGTLYMVNGQCLDLQGRQTAIRKGLVIENGRVIMVK